MYVYKYTCIFVLEICFPTVPLRYDIYYLAEVVEPIAKPKELYAAIVAHIAATLPECTIDDFFFETDPEALRLEMKRNASSADDCEGLGWARAEYK
jgi:hypothetical protein